MKQDLKQVRADLDRLEKDGGEKLTEAQRGDLRARRDDASEDLSEAIDGIRAEIRDILREAKDKDLARRIR
jgi:vacuolar-type H+-ATPase subunit E/Vma4